MSLQIIPKILRSLARPAKTKIVQVVIDGAPGLPWITGEFFGKTELQAAKLPNLDKLAQEGRCGLHFGLAPGITPGSGPAHLALWGYSGDEPGTERGVLETLGIDIDLKPGEVAARGNFATIDTSGFLTDRRAGRPTTDQNKEVVNRCLSNLGEIDGVTATIYPVKDYRVAIVFRGEGLSGRLKDTDPQTLNVTPFSVFPLDDYKNDSDVKKTTPIVNEFINKALKAIAEEPKMNTLLFRGFGKREALETLESIYGIKCLAIATAPMYRGVAKLVGMDAIPLDESLTLEGQVELLKKHWNNYDFFYFHVKKTDSYGEDGNFEKKVEMLEEADRIIPEIRSLNPDVLVVTSDHSTPAILKVHSHHPVPTIFWSKNVISDKVKAYNEVDCAEGALGSSFDPRHLWVMMMNEADRLKKFGA